MPAAIETLREATSAMHRRVEALPYAQAVLRGRVDLSQYVAFLRAMHEIHAAMERATRTSSSAGLRALTGRISARLTLLRADLGYLGADPHVVDAPSIHAVIVAQQIRRAAEQKPTELYGHAYVLEGSQLGGLVQASLLAEVPELRGGGRAYLRGLGRETRASFDELVAHLEDALVDERAIEDAVVGATRSFEGFEAILGALQPTHRRTLAEGLNPDAGAHAVPSDLREVEAALLAGEATWRRFAYYDARYGERGRRFTRSDSAWLVSVAREPLPHASNQVRWLGRLLSNRGMPRLLLEEHLRELHRALREALPDRADRYEALEVAAEQLREARIRGMPEALAEVLIAAHGEGLEAERGVEPGEAAVLLVAAIADERDGIPKAVSSLTEWLLDPARFSQPWIEAGHRTLGSAYA